MTPLRFVCPFCPIHCDDLSPRNDTQWEHGCERLSELWQHSLSHDREAESPELASVEKAVRWVAEARSIVITGQIVDLDTARAVRRFADQTHATLLMDPRRDDFFAEPFGTRGGILTTLGDAAAGHQTMILIGHPEAAWPRFHQRVRGVKKLITWTNTCGVARRLAELRRQLRPALPSLAPHLTDPDLAATAEAIREAEGIVFFVEPKVAAAECARTLWASVGGLISDLNSSRRATLLRFDPQMTMRSVFAWTQERAAQHTREADAIRDGEILRQGEEVDLAVILSPWPTQGEGTTDPSEYWERTIGLRWHHQITIGQRTITATAGQGLEWQPSRLHLPASTPGVSHSGVVIRGDGSVTLPLFVGAETALPAASAWLDQLVGKKT